MLSKVFSGLVIYSIMTMRSFWFSGTNLTSSFPPIFLFWCIAICCSSITATIAMFSLCQSDPCWVNPPAYLTYLKFSDGLKPLSWVLTASFCHSQKIVFEPLILINQVLQIGYNAHKMVKKSWWITISVVIYICVFFALLTCIKSPENVFLFIWG